MKAVQYVIKDKQGLPIGVAKLHLRKELSGNGVLVINANKILYLNKTAVDHIHPILEGIDHKKAVEILAKKYDATREEIGKHHKEMVNRLNVLIATDEVDPFTYLGVKKTTPFREEPSAPLRMDIALTYRCNNNCLHCYAKGPHETKELTTEQWMTVLKKLYDVQIPCVTFTGGECTLRPDLIDIIRSTQNQGLVSGLITNGRKLSEKGFVEDLYKAGLDFVQITIESNIPEVHERITRTKGSFEETVQGIKNCLNSGLFVTTNTTLCRYNIDHALEIVDFLHQLGLKNFAMNSLIHSGRGTEAEKTLSIPIKDIAQTLDQVKHLAHTYEMNPIWYSPTKYCELNPVRMGLEIKSCSAARINMCIDPDGSVLPCQSWFESVGNILTDQWDSIWNHELCQYIRKRGWLESEEKCIPCEWKQLCGMACPLEKQARICPAT